MSTIRMYTKEIEPKLYDAGLANSVHFELQVGEKNYQLNRGYGILFPKAEINENNTIAPRGAKNPRFARNGEKYVIYAEYVNEAGVKVSPGMLYVWETVDFIKFDEIGLVDKSIIERPFSISEIKELTDNIDGSSIQIDDSLVGNIIKFWVAPYGMDINEQRKFKYPLVKGFADPVIFSFEDKWYYLATNDINGNIGIFMREADCVDGLFDESHELSVILDYNEEKEYIQTFWAPEWHIIGGVPYILFAVGGKQWAPQSHMMKYKGFGSIMDPNSWEEPVRVRQMNGSFLSEDGITLDMTYLKDEDNSYVIWSERYHIGTPEDSGSMLYIGTIDEDNPTVLTSEKILLTRPLYGWENVAGTINNEGPYSIIRNNKIIVSYSGGDACGHYYAVGALIADCGADLLNIDNWSKLQTPFLHAYTLNGIDGPGHSSFFVDDEGKDMIAFHGQDNGRQSGIHPVYFSEDGIPRLVNDGE